MNNKEEFEPAEAVEKAAEETAEAPAVTEDTSAEESVAEADAPAADDAEESAEGTQAPDEEEKAKPAEEAEPAAAVEKSEPATAVEPAQKKKKKPFILQAPVMIAFGIVLLALIGYFVYSSFFLHVPQGIIWSADYQNDDGTVVTYYYEFGEDGTMTTTVGSIEIMSSFQEYTYADGSKCMVFYYPIQEFQYGYEARYSITGSRLMHNQEITFTYANGEFFTLREVTEKEDPLELPSEFTPDEKLLGEWHSTFYDVDQYLFINDDGTMQMKLESGEGLNKYVQIVKGTYTIENGSVNFTRYIAKPDVLLLDYSVDGDHLYIAKTDFYRVGGTATPDEATPNEVY